MTRLLAAAVCLAIIACSATGLGQGGKDDMRRAKEKFDKGLEAMLADNYEVGCPLMEEAYRLSQRAGPLFTLAECESRWGRYAASLEHYRKYLEVLVSMPPQERLQQETRRKVATEQVAALEKVVARVTVSFRETAPSGTSLTLDGEAIAEGDERVVDPGEHTIDVAFPDGTKDQQAITLGKGEVKTVELELPQPADDDVPPVVPPGPTEEPDNGLFIAGLVVGSVGVAAVAAGAITGALAFGKSDEVFDNCNGIKCNQDGLDAADTTKLLAGISTVTFIAGGALLAGGVAMVVLAAGDDAPDESALRVRFDVGEQGAGIGVTGVW